MASITHRPSPTLSIQYLEPSSDLEGLSVPEVLGNLHAAAEKLPISHLIIGWQLPPKLLEVCRMEAERLGMRFLRWQPLFTTDAGILPPNAWRAVNLAGSQVPGARGLPEFTFLCPNHPAVRDMLSTHLEVLIQQGIYQGFFLDRVRFPSPSFDFTNNLACFCEHCRTKATDSGLDLDELRREILDQTRSAAGWLSLVKTMLSGSTSEDVPDQSRALGRFMVFRQKSVTDLLAQIIPPLKSVGLEVGLDCFSPALMPMVGQDLPIMSTQVDWIKLMTYAHTLAPAGLPYELSRLASVLVDRGNLNETQALKMLSQFIRLPLPSDRRGLELNGISPLALQREVERGMADSLAPILGGIELVDLEGVTHLSPRQIRADLAAIKRAGPAGLAISWDLRFIPLANLKLIHDAYLTPHPL